MSLLLKALQNAARNREAAGATHGETGADSGDRPAAPGELTLEPVQPAPRASTRAQPLSDEDGGERHAAPRPQQAQTVFRAGARPARTARSGPGLLDWLGRRPLVAFSTAAGLFAIGYGVYLYLQITNPGLFVAQPSSPPPPSPAPKVAAAPRPAEPPLPATGPMAVPPGPAAPATSPAPAPSPAPPAASAPPIPPSARATPAAPGMPPSGTGSAPGAAAGSPAPSAAGSVTPATPPSPPRAAASERIAAERAPSAPSQASVPSSAATPPMASRGSATRPKPAAKTSVATTREPPEGVAPAGGAQVVAVDANVLSAYQALEQGRLDEAEQLYRQAMASDPRSVDAMLGLAATLSQQNQGDAASRLYLRVLEQEPRNAYAQAGLLNIGGRADPVAAEARLKQLIAREPSAFLYFSLGNLYSGQGQWAAAQSAYFQAHNLAPDNPDYAFNLAVGLEHLSQPKLALDYYRRAVALAQSRGHAQFELAPVENRIRALEATLALNP
ncbi:MAG: tetratricopeptide repeat protein [Betaproteobacteria bacterium]|nr:tetratricopeptide repeat protein [Betaproteobacteria bacterium]